jgi:hypothetical protein
MHGAVLAVHESLNCSSARSLRELLVTGSGWTRLRAVCLWHIASPFAVSRHASCLHGKKEAVALGTVQAVSCLTAKQPINTRGVGHATVALASSGSAKSCVRVHSWWRCQNETGWPGEWCSRRCADQRRQQGCERRPRQQLSACQTSQEEPRQQHNDELNNLIRVRCYHSCCPQHRDAQ